MTEKSLIFSFLFFLSFLTYITLGIQTVYRHAHRKINRSFFLICLSLTFWSLGFALATSSDTMETALIWRRFSALGWGSMYAFMLHFLLILTEAPFLNKNTLVKTSLLYLPAIIIVGSFTFSSQIARSHFYLYKSEFGWTNMSPPLSQQKPLDIFFIAYYLLYMLLSLYTIWQWKKKNREEETIAKQANILMTSISVALIFAIATDSFLSFILNNQVPQMAPVLILLPIGSIYYLIKHYDFLKSQGSFDDDLILTGSNRYRLYYYISSIFLLSGLANLFIVYLSRVSEVSREPSSSLYVSLIFFSMGLMVLLTLLLESEKLKNILVVSLVAISIPLVSIQFVDKGAITIWAFPVIFMIASLLFNDSKPLIFLGATAILTQFLLLSYKSSQTVHLETYDFFVRIGVFFFIILLGAFVNQVYIHRLKQNLHQMDFQKLISDISYSFVGINQINIKEKIISMMEKAGTFFEVDRIYIFIRQEDQEDRSFLYEWQDKDVAAKRVTFADLKKVDFSWSQEELSAKKAIHIPDVSKLLQSASWEKKMLEDEGVKSLLVLPIEEKGTLAGFMGIEMVRGVRYWTDYDLSLFRIIAKLFFDGLIKIGSKEAIEYLAYYDQLTGLANRRLFSDRLDQLIKMGQRKENFIPVILIDLDSFKIVNDTMGHSGGDLLLKEVAKRLEERVRQTDTVARFGGDEFLILLNNVEQYSDIERIVKKIMESFSQPFQVHGQDFFISASAGVSVFPLDGQDVESLIKNADITMYTAKEKGKNQFAMCTEEIKDTALLNVNLSNSLYRVEERGELELYYQPQIDLVSGKISGLEALLRWRHPELGMISPGLFIPLAEMNGTINKIGEWVLKEAVSQNKKWQEKGLPPIRVAVNLSAIQLNNPSFIKLVEELIIKSGMEAELLELEVTESAALRESVNVVETLRQLQEMGVLIAIDDFGTEYSSLKRLKELPFDRLKIDIDFVSGIDKSEKDQAIVMTIIKLAKNLRAKVIAEGVETYSQLSFLTERGSDEVQGYYFHKPMPAQEVEKLLKSQIK